jgi:hypothetical protein
MAIQVLVDFANHLTDLRKTGRSDIVLSAFCFAQSQRLDGGENEGKDEDYCTCNEKVKSELRARMVCTYSNLSAQIPVQERLPAGTFPGGFISDLMMNSSSFCKRNATLFLMAQMPSHDSIRKDMMCQQLQKGFQRT